MIQEVVHIESLGLYTLTTRDESAKMLLCIQEEKGRATTLSVIR